MSGRRSPLRWLSGNQSRPGLGWLRERWKRGRHRDRRTLLAPAVLAVAVALASIPFLQGRYPFLLDFVVGPAWDPFEGLAYGLRAPDYGGRLPLFAVLALFPPDWAAKLLLPGGLVLAAVAGYLALPGSRWARAYGALVLVINPFVYERAIAGQWAVVWGVAALPLVLVAVDRYLDSPGPRRLAAAVGALTLLAVGVHLLYAAALLLGALVLARAVADRDRAVLGRAVVVAFVAIPVNAFWLLPALLDGRNLAGVSTANLVAFAPESGSLPPLFAAASMHGFWREGTVLARDLVPGIELLFAVVLFVAVLGAVAAWRGEHGPVVRALVVTAAIALPLATGVSGPTAPIYTWLVDHVPLFGGMRDANKFVGLLVLAYAYLGALGIDAIRRALADADLPDRPSVDGPSARRAATVAVVALLVVVPLVYTFPMVTGYAGQVSVGDYPDAYDEVRDLGTDGDGAILSLPWHGYVDLTWLDGPTSRVRTPARSVFEAPVVQADTLELGPLYSTSTNPVSGAVEAAFGLGPDAGLSPADDLAERLAHADVATVVLAKTADWRAYDDVLAERDGFTRVRDDDHLRVYRVEPSVPSAYTFDGAADGTLAPADHDPVAVHERSPVGATVAGSDREYVAVARSQVAAGPGWRYDGADPVGHRGARPVFAASDDGGSLRYAPFHRLYLPSYGLSALAVALLAGYGLFGRRIRLGRLRPAWLPGRTGAADDPAPGGSPDADDRAQPPGPPTDSADGTRRPKSTPKTEDRDQ